MIIKLAYANLQCIANGAGMKEIVKFDHVTKEYKMGEHVLKALNDVSFSIESGEFVIILGPSGAGKSTLLNLLGGMDHATSGSIKVDGHEIIGLSDNRLTQFRADKVGFVFQFYNLIPSLTSLENVELIKDIKGAAVDSKKILGLLGLEDHLNQFPTQLSGGEQQRVSIARALAKDPMILLCDEPTGALDTETGITILEILHDMSRENGKTVIIVTHNSILAEAADKVIYIKNGKIDDIYLNENPKAISEVNW